MALVPLGFVLCPCLHQQTAETVLLNSWSLKILNTLCLKIFELKNNVRDNITEEKGMESCLSNSFFFTLAAVRVWVLMPKMRWKCVSLPPFKV